MIRVYDIVDLGKHCDDDAALVAVRNHYGFDYDTSLLSFARGFDGKIYCTDGGEIVEIDGDIALECSQPFINPWNINSKFNKV
jgi:hypothetical protein